MVIDNALGPMNTNIGEGHSGDGVTLVLSIFRCLGCI